MVYNTRNNYLIGNVSYYSASEDRSDVLQHGVNRPLISTRVHDLSNLWEFQEAVEQIGNRIAFQIKVTKDGRVFVASDRNLQEVRGIDRGHDTAIQHYAYEILAAAGVLYEPPNIPSYAPQSRNLRSFSPNPPDEAHQNYPSLENELSVARDAIRTLENTLIQEKAKNTIIEPELHSLREKVSELQNELIELARRSSSLRLERDEAAQLASRCQNELRTLKNEVANLTVSKRQENLHHTQELNRLTDTLRSVLNKYRISPLEDMILNPENLITAIDNYITELDSNTISMENRLKEHLELEKSLLQQIPLLKSNIGDLHEIIACHEKESLLKNEQIQRLFIALDAENDTLKKLETELLLQQQAYSEKHKLLEQVLKEKLEVGQERDSLKSELLLLENDLQESQQQASLLKKRSMDLDTSLKNTNNKLFDAAKLEMQNSELNNELHQSLLEKEKLHQLLEIKTEELKNLPLANQEIEKLNNQISSKNTHLSEIQKELSTTKKAKDEVEVERNQLLNIKSELENALILNEYHRKLLEKNLQETREKNLLLEEELLPLRETLSTTKTDLLIAQRKCDSLTAQINILKQRLLQENTQYLELEAKNHLLDHEVSSLKTTLHDLEFSLENLKQPFASILDSLKNDKGWISILESLGLATTPFENLTPEDLLLILQALELFLIEQYQTINSLNKDLERQALETSNLANSSFEAENEHQKKLEEMQKLLHTNDKISLWELVQQWGIAGSVSITSDTGYAFACNQGFVGAQYKRYLGSWSLPPHTAILPSSTAAIMENLKPKRETIASHLGDLERDKPLMELIQKFSETHDELTQLIAKASANDVETIRKLLEKEIKILVDAISERPDLIAKIKVVLAFYKNVAFNQFLQHAESLLPHLAINATKDRVFYDSKPSRKSVGNHRPSYTSDGRLITPRKKRNLV